MQVATGTNQLIKNNLYIIETRLYTVCLGYPLQEIWFALLFYEFIYFSPKFSKAILPKGSYNCKQL